MFTSPIAPALPTAATTPTSPAAANGSAAGGFATMMRSIQAEVEGFIRHGSAPRPLGAMADGMGVQRFQVSPPPASVSPEQGQFLAQIGPWAAAAGEKLGVAPEIISAHAALESGWGRKPLLGADGTSTYNLFGLKAGAGWRGQVADAATTEYVGGAAVGAVERFRSYPDLPAAFSDFAALLGSSPRFKQALNVGADANAYARGLVQGGYASDPGYAAKLARVVDQVRQVRR